ncbi:hypothetical protein D3C73_1035720 [compost metagenome]
MDSLCQLRHLLLQENCRQGSPVVPVAFKTFVCPGVEQLRQVGARIQKDGHAAIILLHQDERGYTSGCGHGCIPQLVQQFLSGLIREGKRATAFNNPSLPHLFIQPIGNERWRIAAGSEFTAECNHFGVDLQVFGTVRSRVSFGV